MSAQKQSETLRFAQNDKACHLVSALKPINENIVQTNFRSIVSARCTPEL